MQKLIYQIEGLEADNGHVRLSVFSEKMAALRKLLREASIEVRDEDTKKLVIQDLRHESPATVIVSGPSGIFDPIADCVATAFQQVRDNTFAASTRFKLIEAADDLVRGVGSAYRSASLTFDSGEDKVQIAINDWIATKISELKLPILASSGSAKGRIEIVNIHSDQLKFYIYRPIGALRRVVCIFPQTLLEEAKEALGRTVTVQGPAKFDRGSLLPTEIVVEKIDVHKEDDDLPTMRELVGSAPGATGDMDTLEFIEDMRRAGQH